MGVFGVLCQRRVWLVEHSKAGEGNAPRHLRPPTGRKDRKREGESVNERAREQMPRKRHWRREATEGLTKTEREKEEGEREETFVLQTPS